MAAPDNTKWGSIVGGYGRIGISATVSNTATKSSIHVEVWFWSKYSVSDSNNDYYYNNNASSATTRIGSKTIKTTVASGSGWSTSNQKLLGEFDYSYDRGTSSVTRNCAAKLSNVDRVGGTMTVTASYTIPALESYKITYNANGGTGEPNQQTKYYGKTLKLSTAKPTRTGYAFQGWGTSATGSVVYDPGDDYTANAADTLYAIWKANTWTVKYDANGGTGAPGQQTKTYGVTLKLSTTKPTRANYNFLGWGISSESTEVAYASGANYTANAAITLYAIWELAYTLPDVTNLTADRCDSSGALTESGTYGKVAFNWNIDEVNSGGLTSIVIQWKQSDASAWNSMTVLSGGTVTSGTVSKIIGDGELNIDRNYDVQIIVTDKKGNAVFSAVIRAKRYPLYFRRGGKGLAIGKPATRDGLDVDFVSYFCNDMYDKYSRRINNGLAMNDRSTQIDPNTTLDELIMTNVNTPNTGYMYIHTMFNEEKSAGANRSQIAIPYNSVGSTYHRYYYNGSWSAWEKHVTESQLNSKLEDTGWLEIIGTPLAVNIKAPAAGTPVKYRKKNGIVFVSGTFGIVNAPTSGNYTLFTLPEECSPDFSGYYYVTNTATGERMSRYLINASGVHLEWVRSIIDGSQSTGAITWAGIDFSFPAKA